MENVRSLVITGGSAGGTSVFLHVDTFAELTRAELTVGMPDAGAFRVMSAPEYPGACCAWSDIMTLHNSTEALPKDCTAATPGADAWKCFTVRLSGSHRLWRSSAILSDF
jgi:hypothetical protein